MIERIQLLRNVGQYDSVTANHLRLTKLSLIYAENGRGKTTLATILRSVGTGNADIVLERQRLTAQHPPHIVLADGNGVLNFQHGAWSRTLSDIVVFDDNFVAENVCSGIELETEHRQKLHELILGAQGVSLNATLQGHVAAIEEHNRRLRALSDAIPAAVRGTLTVDAFCALEPRTDLPGLIEETERGLAAARSASRIQTHPAFTAINLPAFDVEAVETVLNLDLPSLEAAAATRVQDHLSRLGREGETWVSDGMRFVASDDESGQAGNCPFCTQNLAGSSIITHYRAYFGEEYARLKSSISVLGRSISHTHGEDIPAAFERDIRLAIQTREFWMPFTPLPMVEFDTAAAALAWKTAREGILQSLRAKFLSPLERSHLSPDVHGAVAEYERHRTALTDLSTRLQQANDAIELVREQVAAASVPTLEADLRALQGLNTRFSPGVDAACQAYLAEKSAKAATESNRSAARTALDQYRNTIFPTYETAINQYLRRLGAGFRLGNVGSVNTRGGSSCTYNVLINDVAVSVTAASGPSFRNTLSAGDRNTLALAFFFASLEREPNLGQKIVVIDDPMTSLDEHRNRATLNELRRLLERIEQMIVLSHSKSFLCPLWSDAPTTIRSAIRIDRMRIGQNEDASTLTAWDVHADCVSEHDHRHELVQGYLQNAAGADERAVATALRPILEAFMRVAYPAVFPPGQLLGPFIRTCRPIAGTQRQILSESDLTELAELVDYANDFHHDTNPAYQTVMINGQELTQFSTRTLAFARRG